jgi:hypothetical protein
LEALDNLRGKKTLTGFDADASGDIFDHDEPVIDLKGVGDLLLFEMLFFHGKSLFAADFEINPAIRFWLVDGDEL